MTPISQTSYSTYNPIQLSLSATNKVLDVWNNFKLSIGVPVRNILFPLFTKLSDEHQVLLEQERQFVRDFWDPKAPLNPQLPHQNEIRKTFTYEPQQASIELNGAALKVNYATVTSKKTNGPYQNFVLALGNLAKSDTNIMALYPFLASYLEEQKKDPSLSPAQFILLSQYETTTEEKEPFRFKNADDAGQALIQSLKAITKDKGPIQQIVAHSLGAVILGASLKYAGDALPKNIYFDRPPSSVEKLSERFGLWGWSLLQFAKISGWNIDIGLEIKKYIEGKPPQNIFISQVIQDHYFPEEYGLSNSPHIKQLNSDDGIHHFCFDFSRQHHGEHEHHNLPNHLLDYFHLTKKAPLLGENQSMSDLVVRTFVPSSKKTISIFEPLLGVFKNFKKLFS